MRAVKLKFSHGCGNLMHPSWTRRLENAGFGEAGIARVHGPVGVDINARRPKEIALSIMAEVIKVQHQFG